MQINYRVSLAFTKLGDALFDEFAANVVVKLTGNALYPTLPVPLLALGPTQVAFHDALLATAGGGKLLTAVKNEKRATLEKMLRQEAAYVQSVAAQNLSGLLSSGFLAASTNRTPVPLAPPAIKSLQNAPDQRVIVRLPPVANAKSYEAQKKNGGGWEPAGVFGSTRNILLSGFVPGQLYQVQLRAVGGSLGYSEWSQPVSIMAA
jgi:hypothetical protein